MGHSYTEAQARRIDGLRREGRLCGGASRSRLGCTTRATRKTTWALWMHQIGEGEMTLSTLTVCARHAKQTPAGYVGANFEVLNVETF